jgi:hypothetical protein
MEFLAVTGGVAAIAQLIGMVVDTGKIVTKLLHDFHNASDELQRHSAKISNIKMILVHIETLLRNEGEVFSMPPDLQQSFSVCLTIVQRDLHQATKYLKSITGPQSSLPIRDRAAFALKRSQKLGKLVHHLSESEDNLQRLISLLNW